MLKQDRLAVLDFKDILLERNAKRRSGRVPQRQMTKRQHKKGVVRRL
jgi:hypothetical protein